MIKQSRGKTAALAAIALLAGCSFEAEVPSNLRCTSSDDCLSVGGTCVVSPDAGGFCCLTLDCRPDAGGIPDGGTDAPALDVSIDGFAAVDALVPSDVAPRSPEQFAWTAAESIPVGPTMPINPLLAGDVAGNVAVAWRHDLGNYVTQLWWSHRRAGGSWGLPEAVQDTPAFQGDEDNTAVPVAIRGRDVYMGWGEAAGAGQGPGRIVLRHFSDDTGWDKPAFFTGFHFPSVLAQADGGLAMFCGGTDDYYYSRHHAGTGWSEPQRIGGGCSDPAVVGNESGAVLAASASERVLTTASNGPAGSWVLADLLVGPFLDPMNRPGRGYQPSVALGGSEALFCWLTMDDNAQTWSVWESASTTLGRWETPTRIDRQFTATPPRVALSDSRAAVIVWQRAAAGQDVEVVAARRDPGGWTMPERLGRAHGPGGGPLDWGPQVALDPRGNGAVVWVEDASIWSTRLLSTRGWGMGHRIGDDPAPAEHPSIVMDGAGRAVAAWRAGAMLRWSALE
jgi:hypothetical protein